MVITTYQMARWHDGTKGGRLGKLRLNTAIYLDK